jgi:hypothetical protein
MLLMLLVRHTKNSAPPYNVLVELVFLLYVQTVSRSQKPLSSDD